MNNRLDNLPTGAASNRNSLIAGIAIIILGLIALVAQLGVRRLDGFLILPALAVVFLAWGLLTRTFGLIIPGGILSGVALGAYLVEGPLAGAAEPVSGGVFLLAFSLGWALIALLSPITERVFQWWPLVPGAILAAIGGLLLAGGSGLAILQAIGFIWPVILIAAGAYVLIRRK
jgi:hypothetical protein